MSFHGTKYSSFPQSDVSHRVIFRYFDDLFGFCSEMEFNAKRHIRYFQRFLNILPADTSTYDSTRQVQEKSPLPVYSGHNPRVIDALQFSVEISGSSCVFLLSPDWIFLMPQTNYLMKRRRISESGSTTCLFNPKTQVCLQLFF